MDLKESFLNLKRTTMKENDRHNIPFQVETLVQSLQNKKDNDHIRNNFRVRLQDIRDYIDKALVEFDNEMGTRRR